MFKFTSGTLEVEIKSANILKGDGIIDKMDPYITFTCIKANKENFKHKTAVKENAGCLPFWHGEKFSLNILKPDD